jgi:hypothetical protein
MTARLHPEPGFAEAESRPTKRRHVAATAQLGIGSGLAERLPAGEKACEVVGHRSLQGRSSCVARYPQINKVDTVHRW